MRSQASRDRCSEGGRRGGTQGLTVTLLQDLLGGGVVVSEGVAGVAVLCGETAEGLSGVRKAERAKPRGVRPPAQGEPERIPADQASGRRRGRF